MTRESVNTFFTVSATRKEFLSWKSDAVGEHNERLLVGKISLIGPQCRKRLSQKLIGIGP